MAKVKTIPIPSWAHELLERAEIEGNSLRVTEKLERPDYVALNKILEALGGKWNKKAKAHLFKGDPRQLIADTLSNGNAKAEVLVDNKKTFAQFYTPWHLAVRAVALADVKSGDRVLEPSAGSGQILGALLHNGLSVEVVAIDLDPAVVQVLRAQRQAGAYPGAFIVHGDFLKYAGNYGTFNRIIMNPPFSNGEDIKHIQHALTFLRPGGRLVAICAGGSRQEEKLKPLASTWERLPDDTFKEAGTSVRTVLLSIEGKE